MISTYFEIVNFGYRLQRFYINNEMVKEADFWSVYSRTYKADKIFCFSGAPKKTLPTSPKD